MIHIQQIDSEALLSMAFQIRHDVFVIGQNVPHEEEYDAHEKSSTHYLAFWDTTPAGTARWRFTEKGIKLERFAVLEKFRERGVGAALLLAVQSDVEKHRKTAQVYLHAQTHAIKFYERFGFIKTGSLFYECDIPHYKMIWQD
ncbi:MAG: GNAT family N-acetyltransferase [Cytophagales bacterium]|nr:MAG: GNAT family N-acetyltransferase [Cytophagales bacterium]TAF59768.1 MAG: GNAT family N-acetyltransferase [Cytophagales bacterium]